MTSRGGFFGRFRPDTAEGETRFYASEEVGGGEPIEEPVAEPRGFTVEKAARVIDDLPPDVSPESALQIVRRTLEAAGVDLSDLERQSRARETKLNSEIAMARGRRENLNNRTAEVVGSLEEEIRKAQEARDTGVGEEEERISRARRGLGEARRVRAFFGFPEVEAELPEDENNDETQILEGPLVVRREEQEPEDDLLVDRDAAENDLEETQFFPQRARGPLPGDYKGDDETTAGGDQGAGLR